jgi:hypothetical protein
MHTSVAAVFVFDFFAAPGGSAWCPSCVWSHRCMVLGARLHGVAQTQGPGLLTIYMACRVYSGCTDRQNGGAELLGHHHVSGIWFQHQIGLDSMQHQARDVCCSGTMNGCSRQQTDCCMCSFVTLWRMLQFRTQSCENALLRLCALQWAAFGTP